MYVLYVLTIYKFFPYFLMLVYNGFSEIITPSTKVT